MRVCVCVYIWCYIYEHIVMSGMRGWLFAPLMMSASTTEILKGPTSNPLICSLFGVREGERMMEYVEPRPWSPTHIHETECGGGKRPKDDERWKARWEVGKARHRDPKNSDRMIFRQCNIRRVAELILRELMSWICGTIRTGGVCHPELRWLLLASA
jgi:hypothetical protein